eukprot:gene8631-578_t
MSSGAVKLVVLGSGGVGKSCLTVSFIKNKFDESYNPTIEDAYQMQREIEGNFYTLEILDTAGQDEYDALRDLYMQSGDTFILVYSITDKGSFEEIIEMHNNLLKAKGDEEEVPCVLVGAKCDLEQERVVSKEDGIALAEEFGSCIFFETSAKKRINVEEAFDASIKLFNQSLLDAEEYAKQKAEEEKQKEELAAMKKKRKGSGFLGGVFQSSNSEHTKDDVDEEIGAVVPK